MPFVQVSLRSVLLGLLLASSASTIVVTQRAQPSDEAIGRLVAARLVDHDITGVAVSVAGAIVTLRGTVPTLWIKQRAIEQAHKVDGGISVVSALTVPRVESDDLIAEQVAERLQRYVFFTIFDDAEVEVDDGVVTLRGRVTIPYKAEAFADLAAHVSGVQEVRNDVHTLPVSLFDDQLRYSVARRIYGDALFARYAIQVNPPVHIIVEHGIVTLTGAVFSEVERRQAEAIARSTPWVMSVVNKLRIGGGEDDATDAATPERGTDDLEPDTLCRDNT